MKRLPMLNRLGNPVINDTRYRAVHKFIRVEHRMWVFETYDHEVVLRVSGGYAHAKQLAVAYSKTNGVELFICP